jgi:hypothetical protein
MTLSETERPVAERLPYEKPVLRSISLVADQVLGTGCKIAPANPGQLSAVGCVNDSQCSLSPGS